MRRTLTSSGMERKAVNGGEFSIDHTGLCIINTQLNPFLACPAAFTSFLEKHLWLQETKLHEPALAAMKSAEKEEKKKKRKKRE